MSYLLSSLAALVLADTVRFIAGNGAALVTLLSVLAFSLMFDHAPALSLLLSVLLWMGVRALSHYPLHVLNAIPLAALALLLVLRRSLLPALGPCLADLIALATLAYRGWTSKRLLD